MKGLLLAVDRYSMETNKGGYAYFQPKKPAKDNPDAKGFKPMKVAIEFEQFEEISKLNMPCFVEYEVELIAAGQGKAKPVLDTIEPLKEGSFKIGVVEFKQIAASSMPTTAK